ncbi:MAG: efflux RND transporter periplasmic adaptor subunit [Chitinophagales bacterium]
MSKKVGIVVIVIVLIIAGGIGYRYYQNSKNTNNAEETSILAVKTQVADKGSVTRMVSYCGTLKGSNEVYVYPKLAAKVVSMHGQEGDRVTKGQVIATLDSSDYATKFDSARLGEIQALNNYDTAKTNLARTRQLFEAGAASQQNMEQAESAMEMADTALKQTRIQIEDTRTLLSNCQVTSPISGTLGLIKATPGSMVSAQSPLAVVSDLSQMKLDLNVSESDIQYIKPGKQVKVKVQSIAGQEFSGAVDTVALVADPMSRRFPVKIVIENQQGLLKSGMFAEVELAIERKDNVLVIPKGAISESGARKIVYTVNDHSIACELEVNTGIENQEVVEIIKGVKAGDQVIVQGQTLLHDGDKVRVVTGGKI